MSITEKRLDKLAGDIIDSLLPSDPPQSPQQKQIFYRLVKVLILKALSEDKGDTSEKLEVEKGAVEAPNISDGGQESKSDPVRPSGTEDGK